MEKISNRIFKKFGRTVAAAALLSTAFLTGCGEDPTATQWEGTWENKPAPVIESVSPSPDSALAGVSVLTITGSGFSTTPEENRVYFGSKMATVMSATPTQLVIKTPDNPGDSLVLKVALYKSYNFSNGVQKYRLVQTASTPLQVANRFFYSAAADKQGNIFASIKDNGVGSIVKIMRNGNPVGVAYSKPLATISFTNIKVGPNGNIFGVKKDASYAEIAEGGSPVYSKVITASGAKLYDFDFDKNGNAWAAGAVKNGEITLIKPDKKGSKAAAFDEEAAAVRVFGDYLYVASANVNTPDSVQTIYRFPISGTTLGAREVYYTFTASTNIQDKITALTFAKDGSMLIGTDGTQPIVKVNPSRTAFELFYNELYPGGIFAGKLQSMTWGLNDELYYVRDLKGTNELIRVYTQMPGAPYYGRGDQN